MTTKDDGSNRIFKIVGGLFIAVCIYISGALTTRATVAAAVSAPATHEPPAIVDDSWVLQRLSDCDKICGPVPMEVSATRDSIVCTCGRPERIRPMRNVPKPKPAVESGS